MAEFDDLEKRFSPKWDEVEERRLNRQKRQRALSFLFSIDKATASRNAADGGKAIGGVVGVGVRAV